MSRTRKLLERLFTEDVEDSASFRYASRMGYPTMFIRNRAYVRFPKAGEATGITPVEVMRKSMASVRPTS